MAESSTAYCGAGDCTKPAPSSPLCKEHTLELWHVLAILPDRVAELDVTRTRQSRFSRGGTRGSTETPVPFDDRAGRCAGQAATVLSAWQARLADHLDQKVRLKRPAQAAYWLLGAVAYDHRNRLNTFIDAGTMLTDLSRLVDRIDSIIDRPKHMDAWFAGTCSAPLPDDAGDCPQVLYAEPGASVITCRRCRTHHDVAWRRETLLAHANDTLVTATEAARAITVLTDYDRGETRLVRRISGWQSGGRIEVRGHVDQSGKPRPLYRLGDILDRVAADSTTRERTAKPRATELDILTERTS